MNGTRQKNHLWVSNFTMNFGPQQLISWNSGLKYWLCKIYDEMMIKLVTKQPSLFWFPYTEVFRHLESNRFQLLVPFNQHIVQIYKSINLYMIRSPKGVFDDGYSQSKRKSKRKKETEKGSRPVEIYLLKQMYALAVSGLLRP